jgi:hypothetical protein
MANNDFYANLSSDKIKINWNKNPIRMDLFLSFLTVQLTRSYKHLGSDTGWTRLLNNDLKLIVCGGIFNGEEYLNSIEYGMRLQNPYNNYCNPLYLFPIMNDIGKAFFVQYYMSDIEQLIEKSKNSVEHLELKLVAAKVINSNYEDELKTLKTYLNK